MSVTTAISYSGFGEKKRRRNSSYWDTISNVNSSSDDVHSSDHQCLLDTIQIHDTTTPSQHQQQQQQTFDSPSYVIVRNKRSMKRCTIQNTTFSLSSRVLILGTILVGTFLFYIIPSQHAFTCRTRQQQQGYSTVHIPNLQLDRATTRTRNIVVPSTTINSSNNLMMVVQKIEPLTKTSDDRRSRAELAMNRAKVENAIMGMDVQTIEMLSSQFLTYPPSSNRNNHNYNSNSITDQLRKRPKGRPESVPGAMTQETMARYLERQSVFKSAHQQQLQSGGSSITDLEVMAIAPYMDTSVSGPPGMISSSSPYVLQQQQQQQLESTVGESKIPTRQRRKLKGSKTTTSTSTISTRNGELPTASASSTHSSRKRVFKNLPKTKKNDDEDQPKRHESINDSSEPTSSDTSTHATSDNTADPRSTPTPTKLKSTMTNNNNGMDINQYYRTELLTSDEEYSLGMKIQFMDRCEQVHEGLASAMNQLPTIVEWAVACGFTDVDPNFVPTEADEQLRPIGSDIMFEDMDPNMFVGNGLAHQTGPGRGRGRVKRVPPLGLKDFYDDSEYRIQLKAYIKNRSKDKSIPRPRKSELVRPINRGTPTDFVEMLMTAHEAKQRMVQSNMRLVISIARKYANAGVSLQDLVQEGSLGLSRAAEKFEPKKGFKFSTYASWWIQQAVFRSIAYHSRTIRLPVHVHNLLNRVRKIRQTLQSELGRAPTNEEIAEQLGMTRQKFNKMLHLTKQSISLEAPKYRSNPKDLGHESDDLLGDTISKSTILEDEATPQKSVDQGLFHEDLKNMMKILDEDEHRVICARYGLQDGLTRTVTAVAAQMQQSKAWVRSQECRALRKLRRPWYEKKLKEHQDALAC